MSLVPRSEHGKKMTKERLAWRTKTYSIPIAAAWVVYYFLVPTSVSELSSDVKSLAVCIAVDSIILFFFVLVFSYMEVFWYREIPENSFRNRLYYHVALPILYSSLWLYWFFVGTIWVFFVSSFASRI